MIRRVNKKTWEMLKNCFSEALTVKKCPRTAVCTLCKYVDDKKQKINGSLEFSPDE